MLIIWNHEPRIKQIPLGPAQIDKDTKESTPAPMLHLYSGKNAITDPETCKLIKASPTFKRAVEAAKAQRATGKKLRGLDFEEFEDVKIEKKAAGPKKPAGKKADVDETEKDEETVVNVYAKVPSSAMRDLIAKSTTIEQLEKIVATETRPPISAAATARIRALRKDLAENTRTEDDGE